MNNYLKSLIGLLALYLFLVGIGGLGGAFKLMAKSQAEEILAYEATPVVALFIGILATTLVQSSSSTTSLVVAAVAAGTIGLDTGVYMVMGANVGTTVTNTLVSLGHMTRSDEYRRAFEAATVHDFFNLIVLLVLFPLEVATGFLSVLAEWIAEAFGGVGGGALASPIKIATKPVIGVIKDVFSSLGGEGIGGGVAMAVFSAVLMFSMLILLVKTLRSLAADKMAEMFDRTVFRTPLRALGFGILLTVIVQSSSVSTSLAIPLAGAGILTLRQIFPYTMGANIGTTATALLAALGAMAAASGDGDLAKAKLGLVLAFHHVLFNVVGVIMVWPIRALPVAMATGFARLAVWNRLIPVVYIVVTFYLLPAVVVWIGR